MFIHWEFEISKWFPFSSARLWFVNRNLVKSHWKWLIIDHNLQNFQFYSSKSENVSFLADKFIILIHCYAPCPMTLILFPIFAKIHQNQNIVPGTLQNMSSSSTGLNATAVQPAQTSCAVDKCSAYYSICCWLYRVWSFSAEFCFGVVNFTLVMVVKPLILITKM